MNTSQNVAPTDSTSHQAEPQETQFVRLTRDLGELQLHQGQIGILRGRWNSPTVAYDVEFKTNDGDLRVLLLEHYVSVEAPMRKAA
jgi:hypothetical protein